MGEVELGDGRRGYFGEWEDEVSGEGLLVAGVVLDDVGEFGESGSSGGGVEKEGAVGDLREGIVTDELDGFEGEGAVGGVGEGGGNEAHAI